MFRMVQVSERARPWPGRRMVLVEDVAHSVALDAINDTIIAHDCRFALTYLDGMLLSKAEVSL